MKYKIPQDFALKLVTVKDAHELRNLLSKSFPDAFINWDAHAFTIGDTIEKDGQKYMVVKTADSKAALLNLKNGTLWKNFSTVSVGAFNSISIYGFMEISNGQKPDKFKKINKK